MLQIVNALMMEKLAATPVGIRHVWGPRRKVVPIPVRLRAVSVVASVVKMRILKNTVQATTTPILPIVKALLVGVINNSRINFTDVRDNFNAYETD